MKKVACKHCNDTGSVPDEVMQGDEWWPSQVPCPKCHPEVYHEVPKNPAPSLEPRGDRG
jgi:DnaJ-class molecular chaperone